MTIMHLDRMSAADLPRPKERQSQAAIGLALSYPNVLPSDCFWTAIPAGDGQLKHAPGYRAGTPDFIFQYRGRSIWIELKREAGGRVSKEQKQAHEAIERAGSQAYIAHNLAEVVDILREDLKVPVRVRVQ